MADHLAITDQVSWAYPPDCHERLYGRRVWPLGENCDRGVVVEGHDRRSLAALNRYGREQGEGGWGWRRWHPTGYGSSTEVQQLTVEFTFGCGCTREQHAAHDTWPCPCEHPGLPPCEPDQFAWVYTRSGAAAALPVTVVTW